MCRKLGKKKLKDIFGDQFDVNLFRDADGKRILGRNNKPLWTLYTSRMVTTWNGLQGRLYPEFMDNNKITPTNHKLLVKIDNLGIYGSNKPKLYGQTGDRLRFRHYARNNVRMVW